MEHRLLRAFVAVAEELHFGRAARRLHLSQPPLSVQIRKLERDLGAALFVRNNRSVQLTPAGSVLLGRARHILSEAERAEDEVRRTARGEAAVLTIGYAASATHRVLPRILPVFCAANPYVRLELVEMRSAAQPEALRAGRIDVGLVCAPVEARGLRAHVLVRERLVVVIPEAHPLARRRSIACAALDGAAAVGVRPDIEPGWAAAAYQALTDADVALRLVQEADTKIALLGLVAAGMGISVVSESMAALGRDGVVFRPLRDVPLRLPLAILTSEDAAPAACAFLALARALHPTRAPSGATR